MSFKLLSQELLVNKNLQQTAFHIAAGKDDIDGMKYWLSKIKKKSGKEYLLEYKDIWGNTPLRYAVRRNKRMACIFLLRNGADYRCTDNSGNNLLHCAALSGAYDCAQYLLFMHSQEKTKKKSLLDFKNNGDRSPLHLAAQHGNVAMIELFLDYGADIDARDAWGCPPLRYAINCFSDKALKCLICSGASIDSKDVNNGTLLHGAVLAGNAYATSVLLDAGIDATAKNNAGKTALDLAVLQYKDCQNHSSKECCLIMVSMLAGAMARYHRQRVIVPFQGTIW